MYTLDSLNNSGLHKFTSVLSQLPAERQGPALQELSDTVEFVRFLNKTWGSNIASASNLKKLIQPQKLNLEDPKVCFWLDVAEQMLLAFTKQAAQNPSLTAPDVPDFDYQIHPDTSSVARVQKRVRLLTSLSNGDTPTKIGFPPKKDLCNSTMVRACMGYFSSIGGTVSSDPSSAFAELLEFVLTEAEVNVCAETLLKKAAYPLAKRSSQENI